MTAASNQGRDTIAFGDIIRIRLRNWCFERVFIDTFTARTTEYGVWGKNTIAARASHFL